MNQVKIIGAGLAGCEAAWQLANRGIEVVLYEMKQKKKSAAHQLDTYAELVCSNSLRGNSLVNAVGVLKEEMRMMNSLIIHCADETKVPAGGALAVDRIKFSELVTKKIEEHPLITVCHEEVTEQLDGDVIIATGPLTSDTFSETIKTIVHSDYLYFFDAAAPIIEADSIDRSKVYLKSRYDKGEAAYLNCPMTKDEFEHWYQELIHAKCVEPKEFELKIFEGCMPFEEIARRGKQTLLFGPMKPVGLEQPDGTRPYAVVQLRQDNASATMYNIVGFQTHLTFSEQKRLVQLIPGLENAVILRYGVMHRNTYINSPTLLEETYQFRENPNLFFAGQITGVEGYVESAASGLLAGINMAKKIKGKELIRFPRTTAIGSQAYYISHANASEFQPMNANFGLFEELGYKHKKKERKQLYGERAVTVIRDMLEIINE